MFCCCSYCCSSVRDKKGVLKNLYIEKKRETGVETARGREKDRHTETATETETETNIHIVRHTDRDRDIYREAETFR